MNVKEIKNAREFCLQFLFHFQYENLSDAAKAYGENPDDLVKQVNIFYESCEFKANDKQRAWCLQLISGSLSNADEILALLKERSKNWKVERMSKIDLTILLLSIQEIKFFKGTPHNVVINEAIEFAKKYSAAEAPKFINGLLDPIAKASNE